MRRTHQLKGIFDLISQLQRMEGEPQHIDAEMLAPEGGLAADICFLSPIWEKA
jgi:hypothetical protein